MSKKVPSKKNQRKMNRSELARKNVLLVGAQGRMGVELSALLGDHPHFQLGAAMDSDDIKIFDQQHTAVLPCNQKSLAAVIQGADVVIDFSSPSGTTDLIKALLTCREKTVLIGTTGLNSTHRNALIRAAKKGGHKILITGNTSLGVATLAKLAGLAARELAPLGFDIEIIESHHKKKIDAPSGTALLLADVIKSKLPHYKILTSRTGRRVDRTIGIHSVRGGGVVGEHEIRLISDHEELTLSHRAFSRSLFASGALNLIAVISSEVPAGRALNLSDWVSLKSR